MVWCDVCPPVPIPLPHPLTPHSSPLLSFYIPLPLLTPVGGVMVQLEEAQQLVQDLQLREQSMQETVHNQESQVREGGLAEVREGWLR